MARYTEYNGTQVDYDLDSPDPFKTTRTERMYELMRDMSDREYQSRFSDDYDGDWDD